MDISIDKSMDISMEVPMDSWGGVSLSGSCVHPVRCALMCTDTGRDIQVVKRETEDELARSPA